MKFNSQNFDLSLNKEIRLVIDELLRRGYLPTLVGGAVRDFILTNKLGDDLDFELGHETLAFNPKDWKELGKDLGKFGRVSFLSYEVIKLDLGKRALEFSPPRIESYKTGEKGHSNFDAYFDLGLNFSESVARRDFTLNAMGIRFEHDKKFSFLDPLNGLSDLNLKLLRPAGEMFAKDPVRVLRAYRFSIKYDLKFSLDLEKLLKDSHPEEVSAAYFWSEMQKSGNQFRFLEKMIELHHSHPDFKLPVEKECDLKSIKKTLFTPALHEGWIVSLEWSGEDSQKWCKYFGLSSQTCSRLARWAQNSKSFTGLYPENFQGEFEEVIKDEKFLILFDWYFTTKQLLQKNPEIPLMKMIKEFLPDWSYLFQFEAPKDVKHIDPPLRAKYQVWNLCQRI